MELSNSVIFAVSTATLLIGLLLHFQLKPGPERVYLWTFLGGAYLLCGFGSAYNGVPRLYTIGYLLYILVASLCFAAVVSMLRAAGTRTSQRIDRLLSQPAAGKISVIGFWVYLVSVAFPLIYPTFRLNLLWNPPLPDLLSAFGSSIVPDKTLPERLVGYFMILLLPVYLWHLRNYAKRSILLALALFVPLYVTYCSDAYLARGTMLVAVGVFIAFLWNEYQRARKYIVWSLVIVVPLGVVGAALYAQVRLTGVASSRSLSDDIGGLLGTETGLPLNAAAVIDSGQHVNTRDLVLWAVTLPVPKVLTGNIVTFEPNIDMAEIVMNRPATAPGFSVALPGIVGESLYFGGAWLFWLSAAVSGIIFGLLCALVSGSKQLTGVTAFCILLWAYNFNRAGLSSGLPLILNQLLPFFVVVIFLSSGGPAKRVHKVLSPLNARGS